VGRSAKEKQGEEYTPPFFSVYFTAFPLPENLKHNARFTPTSQPVEN